MEARLIEGWLDIVPQWLNFVLRFPVNPKSVLEPYANAGIVSKDLTSLTIGGVAVSYLLMQVLAPPSLAGDQGHLARFLRRIDPKLLPPTMLLLLVAFSVGLHLLAKLYLAVFDSGNSRAVMGGTVEDTVNATLGFASVYIPFAIFVFSLMMKLFPISGKAKRALFGLAGSLNVVPVMVYLPLALAAVHPRTTFWQAWFAFCGAGTIASVGFFLASQIGDKWLKDA